MTGVSSLHSEPHLVTVFWSLGTAVLLTVGFLYTVLLMVSLKRLYSQQWLCSVQTMRSMFPIKQGMRRTLCRQSTCTSQTTCELDLFHLSELSCFPSYTITLTPHNIVSCERISQITCDWKLFFETLCFDLNNNVILFEHEITYPNRFSKLFAESQARIFSWFWRQG